MPRKDGQFRLPDDVASYHLLILFACVTLTIFCSKLAQATFHEHVHIRVHVPEITNEVHHREKTIVKEAPIVRHRHRGRYRHHRHRHRYKHDSIIPAPAMAATHLYRDYDDIDSADEDDNFLDATDVHTAYAMDSRNAINYHDSDLPDSNLPPYHHNLYPADDDPTMTNIGVAFDENHHYTKTWPTTAGGITLVLPPSSSSSAAIENDEKNRSVYFENIKNYESILASAHRDVVWPHTPSTSVGSISKDVGVVQYYHTAPEEAIPATMPNDLILGDDDNDDDDDGKRFRDESKIKLKHYPTPKYRVTGKLFHPYKNTMLDYYVNM